MSHVQISSTYSANLIKNTRGKFFSCRFIKANGEIRNMLARTGVKYSRLTKQSYNGSWKSERGYISVFDVIKKEYRTVNLNTLISVKFNGITYYIN